MDNNTMTILFGLLMFMPRIKIIVNYTFESKTIKK